MHEHWQAAPALHAEAVAAEIGDIAKRYGLHGLYLGRSGCRAFAAPETRAKDSCTFQNDLAMELFQEKKPRLVIIIAQWAGALNGGVRIDSPHPKYEAMARTFDKTLDALEGTRVKTQSAN